MGLLDKLRGRGSVRDVGGGKISVDAVKLRGGATVEIAGESYRQAELDRICGGKTPEGHRHQCLAALMPEPSNPHDENAVAVYIDSVQVGYLSRDDALWYKPVVARLARKNMLGACDAVIVGGWNDGHGDEGHYGVKLDLAPPDHAHPDDPPPPPGVLDPPISDLPQPRPAGSGVSTGASRSSRSDAGMVRGKHYTDWVETVKDMKRLGHNEQVLPLLAELCSAAEAESEATGTALAPWYFEQSAIVRRKLKDYVSEVAILERYQASPNAEPGHFDERLEKAQAKAAKAAPEM